LLLYLRSINTNTVPTQGTDISQALETANDAFNAKEQKYKAVIVITDGEDHEEDAIDKAESVASDGTRIFTVGVGSKQGGTIPVYNESGNIIGDKKDENGQTIISKLNENMLQALAKAGDGNYYILDNAKQVADFLSKDIAKMETKTIRDKTFSDYVEQFQYFVIFALLALLADIFLTYRKKWTDFKNEK
jgi:Ca-activated chloride channel family protein